MDRTVKPTDGFLDKIYKVLPAEITAVYLAIRSVIEMVGGTGYSPTGAIISIFVILFLTVLTPFILPVFQVITTVSQRYFIAASFLIWALNIEYGNLEIIVPAFLGEVIAFGIPITLILWAGLGLPAYLHYATREAATSPDGITP